MKRNIPTRSPVSKLNHSKRKKQKALDWFFAQPHPLDSFLADSDSDNGTRWQRLARQYAAEPFDADAFRAALLAKLEGARYQTRAEREQDTAKNLDSETEDKAPMGKTFKTILEGAGVLDALLAEDTLRELWKSHVLSRISQRSKELSQGKLSLEGTSIEEHKSKVRAMEKELKKFRKLADKNDFDYVEVAPDRLVRKIIRERIAILTWQRTGPKEQILLGLPRIAGKKSPGGGWAGQRSSVRSEEIAIQTNIYRTLKTRLQNETAKKTGISDIFLCQLAELVFKAPGATWVGDGETLRRAINRLSR